MNLRRRKVIDRVIKCRWRQRLKPHICRWTAPILKPTWGWQRWQVSLSATWKPFLLAYIFWTSGFLTYEKIYFCFTMCPIFLWGTLLRKLSCIILCVTLQTVIWWGRKGPAGLADDVQDQEGEEAQQSSLVSFSFHHASEMGKHNHENRKKKKRQDKTKPDQTRPEKKKHLIALVALWVRLCDRLVAMNSHSYPCPQFKNQSNDIFTYLQGMSRIFISILLRLHYNKMHLFSGIVQGFLTIVYQ